MKILKFLIHLLFISKPLVLENDDLLVIQLPKDSLRADAENLAYQLKTNFPEMCEKKKFLIVWDVEKIYVIRGMTENK